VDETSETRIRVRPARPDDLPLILRFVRALAEYEREPRAVVATEEELRRWLFGERPAAEVVFAVIDRVDVGFALFFQNFSTWLGKPGLWLEDLFVLPEHRGRGAGKALLLKLAQTAVERGYGRIEWAVLDWNEPTIAFYRGLGALPMDEWTIFRLEGEAIERLAEGQVHQGPERFPFRAK
jgi:GNAT superfamily N-acetyltransferase